MEYVLLKDNDKANIILDRVKSYESLCYTSELAVKENQLLGKDSSESENNIAGYVALVNLLKRELMSLMSPEEEEKEEEEGADNSDINGDVANDDG